MDNGDEKKGRDTQAVAIVKSRVNIKEAKGVESKLNRRAQKGLD